MASVPKVMPPASSALCGRREFGVASLTQMIVSNARMQFQSRNPCLSEIIASGVGLVEHGQLHIAAPSLIECLTPWFAQRRGVRPVMIVAMISQDALSVSNVVTQMHSQQGILVSTQRRRALGVAMQIPLRVRRHLKMVEIIVCIEVVGFNGRTLLARPTANILLVAHGSVHEGFQNDVRIVDPISRVASWAVDQQRLLAIAGETS